MYSPLCDLCDEPPPPHNHIFEGGPHQQGHGGHVSDGSRHNEPVRRQISSPHVTYEAGEPLHDHKDGHDESCELQHLVQDELDRLPWGHSHWTPVAGLNLELETLTIVSHKWAGGAVGLCTPTLLTLHWRLYSFIAEVMRWSCSPFYGPTKNSGPIP